MKKPRLLVTAAVVAMMASCVTPTPDGHAWAANNRIMLVRGEPATLGYQRTTFLRTFYPQFGRFLQQHGQPDFIAETHSDRRHFIVLYYPDRHMAYACRSVNETSRDVDVTGPHPITLSEVAVLQRLKREARDMLSGSGRP